MSSHVATNTTANVPPNHRCASEVDERVSAPSSGGTMSSGASGLVLDPVAARATSSATSTMTMRPARVNASRPAASEGGATFTPT